MLTNKATPERLEIPHEPGEWMEFRPLSWKQLEGASRARTRSAIALAGEIPSEVYERMGNISERAKDPDPEPTEQYDRATVLLAAITGWSYDDELNKENIEALDEETSEWALRMALYRSVRGKQEGEASAPASNGIISETGATPAS